MSVNAMRQWLGQLPKSILSTTGLDDTQKQLSRMDRLGPKQRPAIVEDIAKKLGIVSERLSQEPNLLRAEDDCDLPAIADGQGVIEPSQPAHGERGDERGGGRTDPSGEADPAPESALVPSKRKHDSDETEMAEVATKRRES